LAEIQRAGEDAWESLKSGAEQVWENIKTTLQESKDAFFEGLQDDK
jgi:TMP repeat